MIISGNNKDKKKRPRVYISGPMSLLPREEYLARFGYAEQLLKAEGFKVVNPTKFLVCRWQWLSRLLGYKLTLVYDIFRLNRCDFIYKLRGWQQSRGANIESRWAYHFKIWPVAKELCAILNSKIEQFIINRENIAAKKK